MKSHLLAHKILLIFNTILYLSVIQKVNAQTQLKLSGAAVGYQGDLNDSPEKWSSGINVGIHFNAEKRYNGNLLIGFGEFVGQNLSYEPEKTDQNSQPNRFFQSNFFSLNYEGHFSIIKAPKWRIFLGAGFGIFRFSPQTEEGTDLINITSTRAENETYGSVAFMLPLKVGFKYYFNNHFGFELQLSRLNPATDYLDNISMLGDQEGNDNIQMILFGLLIPLSERKIDDEE